MKRLPDGMAVAQPGEEVQLGIGDVVIALTTDASFGRLKVWPPFSEFIVTGARPDLQLQVRRGELWDLDLHDRVFDSGGVWRLYRNTSDYLLTLTSPVFGPDPYKVAHLSTGFAAGEVVCINGVEPAAEAGYPLAYPLDEVLMVNLLAQGRGVEVHACGIEVQGKALLFVGASGAGKSTLANLWQTVPDVVILSDDRIILRQSDNGIMAYGTPWHGNALTCASRAAWPGGLFFITHDSTNRMVSLPAAEATSRLLACSFPTFWNPEGMIFTLELIDQVCHSVPCYELGFLPDRRVVDFVLDRVG